MTLTAATIKKLRALNLPDETFDRVLEIIEEAKAKPPKKGDTADRAARGTRLPEDWRLPQPWGVWAMQAGMTEQEVRRIAAEFKDYWTGVAGAKGIKLTWEGTWRTWVRRTLERWGRPIKSPDEPQKGASGPESFTDETWGAIMRRYEHTSQWKPENGPAPGQRGCKVPTHILNPPPRQNSFDVSEMPCHR